MRVDRLGLALQGDLDGRLELDRALDGQRRRSADEDPARRRCGLESRCDVDRVTRHATEVGPLPFRWDRRTDHSLAGVDADADPQRVDLETEPRAETLDAVDHREAGPDGPFRVVVASTTEPE